MIGSYHLRVKTKKVSFDLTLERQISIVRGDTATGKSYFAEIIDQYAKEISSGVPTTVKVITDFSFLKVITNPETVNYELRGKSNGLVIIDEITVSKLHSQLPEIILGSDNYFLLITRLSLSNLPYSIWEIYEFNSSRAIDNGKVFTETLSLRQYKDVSESFSPDRLLVEDSGTGYAFFNKALPNTIVESANGNSNVHIILQEWLLKYSGLNIDIVVDSAAYGAFIEDLILVTEENFGKNNIIIFTPESFEWLVLNTKVLSKYCSFLSQPYMYCDTKQYHSWEVFFEKMLVDLLRERYKVVYSKNRDNVSSRCMLFLLGGKKDILSLLKIEDI